MWHDVTLLTICRNTAQVIGIKPSGHYLTVHEIVHRTAAAALFFFEIHRLPIVFIVGLRQFSSETPKFSIIISERSQPGVMEIAVAPYGSNSCPGEKPRRF